MSTPTNPPASRAREDYRLDDMDRRLVIDNQQEADKASRRERIATAALQGMVANPAFAPKTERLVELAVILADALIAELDRKGGEG